MAKMNHFKRILISFVFITITLGSLIAFGDSYDHEIQVKSVKKKITLSGILSKDKKDNWYLNLDERSKKEVALDRVGVISGANYVFNKEWIGLRLEITTDLMFPEPKFGEPFMVPDFLGAIKGYPPELKKREMFPAGIEEMNENPPEVTLRGICKIVDKIDFFIPDEPINAVMHNGTFEEAFYGSDKLEVCDWPKKSKKRKKVYEKHMLAKARLLFRLHGNKYSTKILIGIDDWKLTK
jgi:hypothetical protein